MRTYGWSPHILGVNNLPDGGLDPARDKMKEIYRSRWGGGEASLWLRIFIVAHALNKRPGSTWDAANITHTYRTRTHHTRQHILYYRRTVGRVCVTTRYSSRFKRFKRR